MLAPEFALNPSTSSDMKTLVTLFAFSFIANMVSSGSVAESCDPEKAMECSKRNDLMGKGQDEEQFCSALLSYLGCLKKVHCLTPNTREQVENVFKRAGYKCGATSITMSLVLLLATLYLTAKNCF